MARQGLRRLSTHITVSDRVLYLTQEKFLYIDSYSPPHQKPHQNQPKQSVVTATTAQRAFKRGRQWEGGGGERFRSSYS